MIFILLTKLFLSIPFTSLFGTNEIQFDINEIQFGTNENQCRQIKINLAEIIYILCLHNIGSKYRVSDGVAIYLHIYIICY